MIKRNNRVDPCGFLSIGTRMGLPSSHSPRLTANLNIRCVYDFIFLRSVCPDCDIRQLVKYETNKIATSFLIFGGKEYEEKPPH